MICAPREFTSNSPVSKRRLAAAEGLGAASFLIEQLLQ